MLFVAIYLQEKFPDVLKLSFRMCIYLFTWFYLNWPSRQWYLRQKNGHSSSTRITLACVTVYYGYWLTYFEYENISMHLIVFFMPYLFMGILGWSILNAKCAVLFEKSRNTYSPRNWIPNRKLIRNLSFLFKTYFYINTP